MTRPGTGFDLLVLEPAEHGHGLEWLRHLAAYARHGRRQPRLAFVVSRNIADRLRACCPTTHGSRVIALSPREARFCTHRSLIVSGLARWWVMRRYLRAVGARQGLFLEFDHLSLPLGLGLSFGASRSVAGILFRPSVHYPATGKATPAERLRDCRKSLLYRLLLRRRAVRRVHVLDDAFPAYAAAHYDGGGKVSYLPDPAHPATCPSSRDRHLAASLPPDRMLFLLFGVLDERKGVLVLLQALARLAPATAARMAVILAGSVDDGIRAALHARASDVERRSPSLWLHVEDRVLRDGEIDALVARADVVLAPYQRFVGSSGVLMWAASRGRPVIAQDYGLLGRLVRQHRLGLTVDTTDPAALAKALAAAVARGSFGLASPRDLCGFAGGHRAGDFAAAILDPVLDSVPRTATA